MTNEDDLGGDFHFTVGINSGVRYPTGEPYRNYYVELPHQCEEWSVAWGPDKAAAVAELERFIAEAQNALVRLRALP